MTRIADLLELLERARHDIEHGWPEAACDALGRASRLTTEQTAHSGGAAPSPTETHP